MMSWRIWRELPTTPRNSFVNARRPKKLCAGRRVRYCVLYTIQCRIEPAADRRQEAIAMLDRAINIGKHALSFIKKLSDFRGLSA
jgi:hypothetical protein